MRVTERPDIDKLIKQNQAYGLSVSEGIHLFQYIGDLERGYEQLKARYERLRQYTYEQHSINRQERPQ